MRGQKASREDNVLCNPGDHVLQSRTLADSGNALRLLPFERSPRYLSAVAILQSCGGIWQLGDRVVLYV